MRHGPIAWWLLDELRDEEHRERQFSASQDTLRARQTINEWI